MHPRRVQCIMLPCSRQKPPRYATDPLEQLPKPHRAIIFQGVDYQRCPLVRDQLQYLPRHAVFLENIGTALLLSFHKVTVSLFGYILQDTSFSDKVTTNDTALRLKWNGWPTIHSRYSCFEREGFPYVQSGKRSYSFLPGGSSECPTAVICPGVLPGEIEKKKEENNV